MTPSLTIGNRFPLNLNHFAVVDIVRRTMARLCAMVGSIAQFDDTSTDEQLMTAYLDGDQHAFRCLFNRYAPQLHRAALRRGLSADDAADVVQQAFVHLHQGRRDFKPDSALRPWLYTIAFNIMRDYGRRRFSQRRLRERLAREPSVEATKEPTSVCSQPTVMQKALNRLSNAQREVLVLHYFEELSFKEIAGILGGKEGAVRGRAHRAYEKLRAILAGRDV